ncbi:alpha/beta fold hydrolase [Oceanobacillus saliphilus]|uniref:alpha/beta fold hydrolase n=1 Tax=Oceanobacillus saliphilus TaxID=2925834 RepID=UPI00201D4B9E|nr:alpha/beta hydrolase [Oceanobacillus saliphilus]
MEFRTSDGLELYYDKSGKGVPCVYLHGGPGYWSKSFQHYSQQLLEDKLEMVYLDQRGCGRSENSPAQDYSLSRIIADIEELRIFLGVNEWYVMGHSFGGILAVNYAERYPEGTKGIILSNVTLNMIDSFGHQINKGSNVIGIEVRDLSTNNISSFIDSYFSILTQLLDKETYFKFQYMDLDNKKSVDLIDQYGLNSDPIFQQYVFSSEEYFQDFTLLSKDILKPVLIIAGDYDDAVGPKHHQLFNFPNSKTRVINGGHHPYIENQLEFKDAILNFVKE